ncbi:hypothetical protein SUNI508_12421 [Seiridium unicorne]|uniref:RRM Nup35-type domain-containing protein n=1 Tax=Seiridium unicorne TaxID=138068 RepID=A0ABR2UEF7_9PEZI
MSGNEQHQSRQHTGNGRPSQPVAQSEYSPIRGDRSFQPTFQAQGGGRRPYDPNNRSDDIPDSENCDQWILGIPAGVTYQEFLKLICDYGRVWSIHVLRDTGKAGEEYNACAMAFLRGRSGKGIPGDLECHWLFRSWSTHSRQTKPPTHQGPRERTEGLRCIIVHGTRNKANETSLLEYFL